MARRRGKIPQNLIIFSRAAEDWNLDAMWNKNWDTASADAVHKVRGRKAFAVDKDSKSAPKTAERWANAVPILRQKARSRIAMLFEDIDDAFEETPNEPLKNLRVFQLEIRGEGGRAYKVIDERGYVWDMREDVLLEAMIECGIQKGGTIGGEYVWGILGSQIRLVRVGSELYDDLNVSTLKGKLKKIGLRDLRVGGVYATKGGNRAVFCGFVHSKASTKKKMLWVEVRDYDYNPRRKRTESGYVDVPPRNHQEAFDYVLSQNRTYGVKVKQSHTYIEHLADVTVPDDIVARVRNYEISRSFGIARNESTRRRSSHWYGRVAYTPPTMSEALSKYLENITLTPHGQPVVLDDRVAEYVR